MSTKIGFLEVPLFDLDLTGFIPLKYLTLSLG